MSRPLLLAIIVGVMGAGGGCAIFQAEVDEQDVPPVEEPEETPALQASEQIEEIERMRDRDIAGGVEAVEGEPAGFFDEGVPASVRDEWKWFEEILFGGREAPLVVDDPEWASRVGFDETDETIVFDGDPRDDEMTAFAIAMIGGLALEESMFEPLAEPESVDEWLTRAIIRRAGPAFGAIAQQAHFYGIDADADHFADRPELAIHVPGIGDKFEEFAAQTQMTGQLEPPEGTEYFEEALQQFVLRKALSVGSALYRAGGWAGVEWGRSEPPMFSDYVVRPQSWFDGDGRAEWEWPTSFEQEREDGGWDEVRRGRVGPAVASLWFEGIVGPRAARSIYSAWLDDTYRIYTRGEGDEEETSFHWISAWETPHDAQELASATEAVLGHYLGHDHREQRFRVASRGVNVAVTIYDRDQEIEDVNREVELLTEAGPGFLPDDPAPFEFSPTLYDRYVEETEEATLDLERETWTDPASGWTTEIGAFDGWTVQRADEPHVRWFGNHPDGTLVQWTTELVDPLGPAFGSEDYIDSLAASFAESVSASESPEVTVVDDPVESTIELEVVGTIEDRPTVLRLWQWKRGDVLVTFSLQGPENFFGERLDQAQTVLERLEPHGEPVEQRASEADFDPRDDEGIIEFEVEDGE